MEAGITLKPKRDGFLFDRVKKLSLVDNPETVWRNAYHFKDIDGLTLVRVIGDSAPNGEFEAQKRVNVTNVTE